MDYLKAVASGGQFQSDALDVLDREERNRELRRIRKRARNYVYKNGAIWRTATTRHPERQVPAPDDRTNLILELHNDLGHQGRSKVLGMLSSRFYWPGMSRDVAIIIAGCADCNKQKVQFKQVPEMRPLPPKGIMERVAVDTLGPFPRSRRGNRYVFVAQDPTSKWPMARATPDKSADNAARFLLEEVIAQHGAPATVLTDQGSEFRGIFEDTLREYHCAHQISPAYHPQSNGQVERLVGTISRALQKCISDTPADWDKHVPKILLGYRSAPQASTRYSPAMLIYGRELVLPSQLRAGLAAAIDSDSEPALHGPLTQQQLVIEEELQAMANRSNHRQQLEQRATENILAAQEKQKADFKRRKLTTDPSKEMPEGSMVWQRKPPSLVDSKLDSQVEGPYELVKWNPGCSKANIRDGNGHMWTVHANRLAPYEM